MMVKFFKSVRMLPMMVALAGVTLALGAMPLPATAAGLPLAGEMRKLTIPAEQRPVAAAEFQDEKGQPTSLAALDRKRGVEAQRLAVGLEFGGRGIIKKK